MKNLITEKDFTLVDAGERWNVVTKDGNVMMAGGFKNRYQADKFRKTAYFGYYENCVVRKEPLPYGVGTIGYHLSKLPEPYKSKAIANTCQYLLMEKAPSKRRALFRAFIWEDSPEGPDYWGNFVESL